ncbi:uncharacterized protein LTR77_001737 [Saxophila tyrrhenica]|uniref:Uncharacterized protein n=1 Tax=Saxophila tyrrhenica TaxID=1690608 RepID=A0AAV9PL30_9PEZI|nr:hypothetical protein LTR77_001737 [Saxophila tyrrhenica]
MCRIQTYHFTTCRHTHTVRLSHCNTNIKIKYPSSRVRAADEEDYELSIACRGGTSELYHAIAGFCDNCFRVEAEAQLLAVFLYDLALLEDHPDRIKAQHEFEKALSELDRILPSGPLRKRAPAPSKSYIELHKVPRKQSLMRREVLRSDVRGFEHEGFEMDYSPGAWGAEVQKIAQGFVEEESEEWMPSKFKNKKGVVYQAAEWGGDEKSGDEGWGGSSTSSGGDDEGWDSGSTSDSNTTDDDEGSESESEGETSDDDEDDEPTTPPNESSEVDEATPVKPKSLLTFAERIRRREMDAVEQMKVIEA